MREELRKIEYRLISAKSIPRRVDEEPVEIKTEYGYFHKWSTVDGNEYALIENRDGYVCMLNIFEYNIKFIYKFPSTGRFIEMKIGDKIKKINI